MQFIKPLGITSPMVVSSNIPAADYALWVSTSTYAKDDKRTWKDRNWQALGAVPAGTEPGNETVTTENPLKWLDLGATNRMAMFDEVVGTRSTHADSVTVTVRPGSVVNSIALLNLAGQSVTVTMTDSIDGVVYQRTATLIDAGVDNWYDWFFADIDTRTSMVLLDLPAYGTADITVTVNSSGTAAIGALVMGKLTTLGITTYTARVGIDDYSVKKKDDFGNFTVVERAFADNGDFPVVVETERVTKIKRLLTEIRAKPVVWIAESTYEAAIIYGFYTTFDITYGDDSNSNMQITIEGLT
ncbi:hypothetical protein ACIPL1_30500 [Pseudomonas sp. NPDC090202]|uniref:hypothetical protein n=1 Tax=Pseudomonas sp. NPDC090202 TaxID=3364476 RepID=UPI003824B341